MQVIRNYHGHLSGVYSLAQHPTIDVIMTGGRDAGGLQVARMPGVGNKLPVAVTQRPRIAEEPVC